MPRKTILLLVLLILLLVLGSAIQAAPSAYSILRWTVDGGGKFSCGGTYRVSGTIGQPDAGSHSGGSYTIVGGFWGGAGLMDCQYDVHLPISLKNSN